MNVRTMCQTRHICIDKTVHLLIVEDYSNNRIIVPCPMSLRSAQWEDSPDEGSAKPEKWR